MGKKDSIIKVIHPNDAAIPGDNKKAISNPGMSDSNNSPGIINIRGHAKIN